MAEVDNISSLHYAFEIMFYINFALVPRLLRRTFHALCRPRLPQRELTDGITIVRKSLSLQREGYVAASGYTFILHYSSTSICALGIFLDNGFAHSGMVSLSLAKTSTSLAVIGRSPCCALSTRSLNVSFLIVYARSYHLFVHNNLATDMALVLRLLSLVSGTPCTP